MIGTASHSRIYRYYPSGRLVGCLCLLVFLCAICVLYPPVPGSGTREGGEHTLIGSVFTYFVIGTTVICLAAIATYSIYRGGGLIRGPRQRSRVILSRSNWNWLGAVSIRPREAVRVLVRRKGPPLVAELALGIRDAKDDEIVMVSPPITRSVTAPRSKAETAVLLPQGSPGEYWLGVRAADEQSASASAVVTWCPTLVVASRVRDSIGRALA
jgi:hypothetical protein